MGSSGTADIEQFIQNLKAILGGGETEHFPGANIQAALPILEPGFAAAVDEGFSLNLSAKLFQV